MNIYLGNLPFKITENELENLFNEFGAIKKSIKIITDNETGRSRGFGFVEFENREDGESAIEQLSGKELHGRELVINESRPKKDKYYRYTLKSDKIRV